MLAQIALEETRKQMEAAEHACVDHYRARHLLRFFFWRRLGWAWLMYWPSKSPEAVQPDASYFDPVRFIEKAGA